MRVLLQFTLDLFDAAAGEPSPPPPGAPRVPAIPLADAQSPASVIHPRATREILLADARVA